MTAPETSVLYLSPYFWPEEIGSAPYCSELARYLSDTGFSVSALSFRPHYPDLQPFSAWSDGARDHDNFGAVQIERVPVNPRGTGGFRERIRNDLRFLRRALLHAVRGTYRHSDVIVAYVPSCLTLFGSAALKLRGRAAVVAVVHDIESGLAQSLGLAANPVMIKLMRLVERLGLNLADEVIVLTDGMKAELEDLGCKRPITVLPIWSQIATSAPIDPSRPTRVMYSGNFGKKQNLDQLLPLMSYLSTHSPEVEIILRGDGSERARIKDEVARQGVKNARFMDLAPAETFMQSLQNANLHLVPQALNVANYALPSKLFSIMAAGRPFVCIAEPNSPLDHLAQASGAGICVYPDDDVRLCHAVSDLIADPARQQRMGDAGRTFVQRHMNRETILDGYLSILRRVTGAKSD